MGPGSSLEAHRYRPGHRVFVRRQVEIAIGARNSERPGAVLEIEPRVAGIDVLNMSVTVTTQVGEVAGQVQSETRKYRTHGKEPDECAARLSGAQPWRVLAACTSRSTSVRVAGTSNPALARKARASAARPATGTAHARTGTSSMIGFLAATS